MPLWNIAVFFHYTPRRVVCPVTGRPTVELMPWNHGKSPYSIAYMHIPGPLGQTAVLEGSHRNLPGQLGRGAHVRWNGWSNTDWNTATSPVSPPWASTSSTTAAARPALNFLTLVYQIDRGSRRLLWIGRSRTEATLREGFDELEKLHAGFLSGLRVVCSDMWKPFLKVVRERCGQALNVLDPFHVARHLNEALDSVRRSEQARLTDKADRKQVKGGRFLLLKRGTKVRGMARAKLHAVLASLGQTSRAWELKESFRRFWLYRSPTWAAAYLREWTARAMRSRITPMKKVATMLRKHEDLLLNYFRAKRQYTNAMVEGMNHKARVSLARIFILQACRSRHCHGSGNSGCVGRHRVFDRTGGYRLISRCWRIQGTISARTKVAFFAMPRLNHTTALPLASVITMLPSSVPTVAPVSGMGFRSGLVKSRSSASTSL